MQACQDCRIEDCKLSIGPTAAVTATLAPPGKSCRIRGLQACQDCRIEDCKLSIGPTAALTATLAPPGKPKAQYCLACKVARIATETSNEHADASNGHTDEHVDLARSCAMK